MNVCTGHAAISLHSGTFYAFSMSTTNEKSEKRNHKNSLSKRMEGGDISKSPKFDYEVDIFA